MSIQYFPPLDTQAFNDTRNALQSYAHILGDCLKTCRAKRKHWWHASLRPSLNGLTTGVVHAEASFELELSLNASLLQARAATGEQMIEVLRGQPGEGLAQKIRDFMQVAGIEKEAIPESSHYGEDTFSGYSASQASHLCNALSSVSATMQAFRAGIREETSPIQLWPHHFDLAMLWLPGSKVLDQEPENEEYADQQMNFGFTFGDAGIPEPYFYITAYPLPQVFSSLALPAGSYWKSDGFSGAVLLYRTLMQVDDPTDYLLNLWNGLYAAGQQYMLTDKN